MSRRRIAPLASALLLITGLACSEPPADGGGAKQAQAGEAASPEGEAKAPAGDAKAGEAKAPAEDAKAGEAKAAGPAEEPKADDAPSEEPKAGEGEEAKAGEAPEGSITTTIEPAARPDYELLEAGEGDKVELRFAPKAGQVERMQLTMVMEVSLDFGAMMPPQTQKAPPITMVNRGETVDVQGGKITERVVFESFDVAEGDGANAAMATAMREAMSALENFEQRMVYDTRGVVLEGELKIPANTDPQLAQSLDNLGNTLQQVMVRFPEEAVGKGAKWREVTTLESNGLKLEQTSEHSVVAIDGNRVTLSTSVSQKPASKDFEAPGMPPGVEVELVEFESSGGGEMVFDTGYMFPESGSSKMDTSVKVATEVQGQKQEFATNIKLTLTIERLPEDAGAKAKGE